jgi:hypothetical protein
MSDQNKGKKAKLRYYGYCELCRCTHGKCSLCDEMVFDELHGGEPKECPECGATFEETEYDS